MHTSIFWFRRDLRLHDNAGLYHALKNGIPVVPIFIFDTDILGELPKRDARVEFIHQVLCELKTELERLGSSLWVYYGRPVEVWRRLIAEREVTAVFANRDYEPYAIRRDKSIEDILSQKGVPFKHYKDHVIFEKSEILKPDGTPYTVFTPFSRRWSEKLLTNPNGIVSAEQSFYLRSYPTEKYFDHFVKTTPAPPVPTLAEMGFEHTGMAFPPQTVTRGLIKNYDKTRNIPAIEGTSRLGVHFRFGTISIREKARHALGLNSTYLNELIWRDFYSQILAHFPQVVTSPFRPEYDLVKWRDAPQDFERWKNGLTGYPIVDAGMRELNATGFMHNRSRMITASFLTKHLLLDWRLGEAYFAEKLLDFDLASNSGGWQWAAGCGTDAAPYFRIFNPTEQAKKFDPEYRYIRKWVPEFGSPAYPKPMVEHAFARERCLAAYREAFNAK